MNYNICLGALLLIHLLRFLEKKKGVSRVWKCWDNYYLVVSLDFLNILRLCFSHECMLFLNVTGKLLLWRLGLSWKSNINLNSYKHITCLAPHNVQLSNIHCACLWHHIQSQSNHNDKLNLDQLTLEVCGFKFLFEFFT